MSAALIPSLFIFLAVALFATAEPQLNVVGEGLMSNPVTSTGQGKGMRYAGPIVYTNEKPPIIYFPPPPKDAKPGFNVGGSYFGKSKSPKSIKYVPMPHHDLPVLIYTSDKTPPIHVVHPTNGDNSVPPQGSISYGSQKEDFGPPPGSLSSTYRGILPAGTSPRIVTSSYEIPSTSYGTPMKAFGGSGSSDLSTASSSEGSTKQQYSTLSFGSSPPSVSEPSRPFGAPGGKKPPHIMYSGHPPIHIFNQPDMFVRAPKQVPLKTYEELPPKASFGPPKSSFGPPSGGSFGSVLRNHHRRPAPSATPFGSPQRPYVEENLVYAGSSNNPSSVLPTQNNQPSSQSSISYIGGNGGSPPAGPPTYSFAPQHSMFSFGPFSVEYGPPSEPFVSFSEPTGSLSSFYGTPNEGNVNGGGPGAETDGWMPGPPPTDIAETPNKENEWNGPPLQQGRPLSSYKNGPGPMHSVFLPSSNSRPLHPHHHPLGGSKLAHLFSSFKLKRNKPKYAIAPKSMHKPPIIIYYGKKPPVHVYEKPETEGTTVTAAASTHSISVTSAESGRNAMGSDNGNSNSNENIQSSSTIDNIDLTYGASQNTEVRVAAPPASSISSDSQNNAPERKPAIIQAKPVDIFSSAELQPSIYMARNSLNTIFVSDLSGSGTKALKTFIVRRSEDSNQRKLAVAEATVFPPISRQQQQQQQEGSIIISNIAQNRISGGQVLALPIQQREQEPEQEQGELVEIPVSVPEATQVDLEQLEQQDGDEEVVEDNRGESSNDSPSTTILVAPLSPSQTGEEMGNEDGAKEQSPGSRKVQVAIIQSPSSFQTSLSQAEKEAEEAQAQADSSS